MLMMTFQEFPLFSASCSLIAFGVIAGDTENDEQKMMNIVLRFLLPLRVKVENNHEASKQYKKTKIS
jgi:hypothetical protein